VGQVIWILLACVAIGTGIALSNRVSLAIGVTMYMLPFGIAVLHYLKSKV